MKGKHKVMNELKLVYSRLKSFGREFVYSSRKVFQPSKR